MPLIHPVNSMGATTCDSPCGSTGESSALTRMVINMVFLPGYASLIESPGQSPRPAKGRAGKPANSNSRVPPPPHGGSPASGTQPNVSTGKVLRPDRFHGYGCGPNVSTGRIFTTFPGKCRPNVSTGINRSICNPAECFHG